MSAKIMEKANELAEAIAECDELVAMREAEIKMNNDSEAVVILDSFRKKQQEVYSLQMSGSNLSDQDKKDIEEIEGKMSGNSNIKAFIDASQNFENLMKSVNLVISRAISGDSGDSGCGCGSDCGSECGPSCGCS